MPTMFMHKLPLDRLPFDKLGLDRLGLDRRREELEEALAGSTALLAVVGAGDLAVERLRAARAEFAARSSTFDPATFREQAQATLVDRLEALQTGLMATPEQITQLPERAQEWPMRAQSMLADLVSAAFSTYGELAGRGKTVVTQSPIFADDDVELMTDPLAEPPVTRPLRSASPESPSSVVTPSTVPVKQSAAKTGTAKKSAAKTSAAKTGTAKTGTAKTSAPAKKTTPTRAAGPNTPKPDAGPTATSS